MRFGIFLIFTWIVASYFFELNRLFLPESGSFFNELLGLVSSGDLLGHLSITFVRVITGVGLACVIGVPMGLLLGRNKLARKELTPTIEFLRGIPTSMLFPLFIVLFGLGELSKVLIAFYLAAPVIIINTMIGALPRQAGQGREDYIAIHSDKISLRQKVMSVLWEASPSIIGGVKIAISLGLVVIIVTEMFFVASSGIGWAAFRAYEAFDIDKMYIYIISAGAVGVILNTAFDRLAHYFNKASMIK